MKSVLISIRPKWCELIASGKKTIEVRKSCPKIETPFKCYIYCTMGDVIKLDGHRTKATKITFWLGKPLNNISPGRYTGNGMVVGEFVCDKIYNLEYLPDEYSGKFGGEFEELICKTSCLSYEQIMLYKGDGHAYGWHISDLKIYEKPRELSEFWKAGKCPYASENGCTYNFYCFRAGKINRCGEPLSRAPQSWCYVEELQ